MYRVPVVGHCARFSRLVAVAAGGGGGAGALEGRPMKPREVIQATAALADARRELARIERRLEEMFARERVQWFAIERAAATWAGECFLAVKPTKRFRNLLAALEASSGEVEPIQRAKPAAQAAQLGRGKHGSELARGRKGGKR